MQQQARQTPDNPYLDWSIHVSGDTFASTSRGQYSAEEMSDDEFAAWFNTKDGRQFFLGPFGTQDEAENACQRHYEGWRT